MKVDPIMLGRGVYVVDRETISKNDEQVVKNKRGFRSVTQWRKRERSNIGINRSDIVHFEPAAAAAPAAETNAPKSILRSPNQSYDLLVSIDHIALSDDCTVNTISSKKITWDVNVKDVTKKKTVLKAVVDNLKDLAIGLDTNVQKVREKMQCGNMAVAKDFYCPSEGNLRRLAIGLDTNAQKVREKMQCGNMGVAKDCYCPSEGGNFRRCFVDEVDGGSLGTNDLVYDDDGLFVYDKNGLFAAVEEAREEVGIHRDHLTESRETPVEESEDRYGAFLAEPRIENPVPTSMTAVRRKKKNRNPLVYTSSPSHYYTRATPVTSPTSSKTAKKVQGRKVVAKAPPAKSSTRMLQSDESYISALTDPSSMSSIPTKKASKRHQEKLRYTTLPPKQSKKGLQGALAKPIKFMAVGLKLNTRKMLTSKANI